MFEESSVPMYISPLAVQLPSSVVRFVIAEADWLITYTLVALTTAEVTAPWNVTRAFTSSTGSPTAWATSVALP